MSSYLVTGGAGFIGSHLVDALTARGDDVVVLDDLSTGTTDNLAHVVGLPLVRVVEGSVLDAPLVDELMADTDVCLHLASAVGVQLIMSRPLESLLANVRGTDVVFAAAARHRRRLLFTSTSEIYGKRSDGALDEDADRILGSAFKARWNYAIAKSFAESLAHGYHRSDGTPITVARLFNTVGPRQTGVYGMVLPRFVRQALAEEELTVYGNGTQTRCFAHVLDVVQALLVLVDRDDSVGGAFNIGSEDEIAIVELARRIIDRTRSTSTLRLVPYDEAYDDGFEELGRRRPDTTAVRELTGWTPTRTVDDAIDDVIAYERNRTGSDALAS